MRSTTLHLFAAAVLAVPTLTLAQSDENALQNRDQNQNQNDPFVAPDIEPPMMAQIDKQGNVSVRTIRPDIRTNDKATMYASRATGGIVTSSAGFSISSVPPAMAAQLRLEKGVGVVVEDVAQGSPLQTAGIEQYDVIEKVDGHAIRQPRDLTDAIRRSRSDSLSFDIVRQARRRSVTVDKQDLASAKSFSYGGGIAKGTQGMRSVGGGFGASSGMSFGGNFFQPPAKQNDDADRDREQADRDRQQADRDRAQAERERAQADRERAREQAQAVRQKSRDEQQNALENLKNVERDQINAIREQVHQQLDQERKELDRAREQLNRASEQMNRQLSELRAKLEPELRNKIEEQLRKGEDQIREKMKLLDDQNQQLEQGDRPGKE